ncbi:uncharacterized protein LOC111697687 isoform X3 [Eurytemora carolleeae]|uniref:uncharacterized protein LOC111697687 isoform X3 n=1 Tax=Eurytemora carolleeae TaxID=1294199 RepID=UPI000C77D18A|nr:uncharacterized protein LOC111697687 isoform X3 [Eurytemora carolleeae]|eukprot:XP_023323540.1 uncharacterized protein LOC111697687 isoform X3 [Eurytemora affinis]
MFKRMDSWKIILLFSVLHLVHPQDLEPVNKMNITALVTNADYTDVYIETNNESDLFHKSAHFNLTTEQQHLTTDNQLPMMENQRSDEISLQSTTTPLDQKETAEDILSTDEHFSSVDILSAVDDISLNPSKYLAVNYVAKIQVKDQGTGNQYTISEIHSKDDETIKLSLVDPRRNATSSCSMYTGGFGHATTGVRCRLSRNLPQECFCWDGLCLYPFYTLSSTVQQLVSKNGKVTKLGNSLLRWRVEEESLEINAIFRLVGQLILPLEVEVKGFGYSLGTLKIDERAHIKYSVIQFEPMERIKLRMVLNPDDSSLLHQEPGIFCPKSNLHPPRSLPELPRQFSVKIETIMEGNSEVSYSHQNYDLPHKLVSVKLTPRVHTPPSVFLTTLALAPHLLPQTYNIIHDFNTGLQYTVSERTGNCTVEPIQTWMGDAARMEGRPVRLKLASELLQVKPADFVYSGRRKIRGIGADVWTAEKDGETAADEYSTIELYFSESDWTMQVEDMNEIKNVPLGMATYYADSRTAPYFHTKVESHYFEFSSSHPSWKLFDISKCLSNNDRLYLRITLNVTYGQLVQFSLATAQESIRAALAKTANISPLRLVDLFISSSRDSTGVDIWFILLEKPQTLLKGGEKTIINVESTLAESYETLSLAYSDGSKLRLQLDSERNMLVGVTPGSLQVVGESAHPSSRNRSYLFLRTHYTAGSMAGLGFSMAVLGLSIGILVGFLLWKRRLGLPTFPHLPHIHLPHCSQATPILSSSTTDMAQLTSAYPGPPLQDPRY